MFAITSVQKHVTQKNDQRKKSHI